MIVSHIHRTGGRAVTHHRYSLHTQLRNCGSPSTVHKYHNKRYVHINSYNTVRLPDKVKSINITAVKANNKTTRFYKNVNVIPTDDIIHLHHSFIDSIQPTQYCIMLDTHFLTTPDNRLFTVPTSALACCVATEWDIQTHRINIDTMPITHICMIACDQAIDQSFLKHFRNYVQFDSTCIRAINPTPLVRLQRKLLDPMIERMKSQYNISLNVSSGIMTPNQSNDVYHTIHTLLLQQSPLALACIDSIASVSKSFVIAWLLYTNQLSIDQAYRAARLDEDYQIGQYGHIEGAFGHSVEMTYVKLRLAATQTILHTARIQAQLHSYHTNTHTLDVHATVVQ